jgi:energy-coupling factor transporter ATP-binding protein EcfA2
MIRFENVSFIYQSGAHESGVKNINLQIPDGQMVLICGESGCGKTTLTRMINGLIPEYYEGTLTGEVYINDLPVFKSSIYKTSQKVGSVFQNPRSQFFNVDTTDEIAFGCENMGIPRKKIYQRMGQAIGGLGINYLMERSLFALSGGEKQKIACASVAAMEPDIFVLDEPSSNLDVASIQDLACMIEKWKQKSKTIVIAEHRLYYLMDLVDRILYMKDGKILRDMTITEFQKILSPELAKMGLRSFKRPAFHIDSTHRSNNKQIEISNFSFSYGKQTAIHIPELTIPVGAIIGVLGNNGAGKTTFAKCLCGLEKKARGELRLDGKVYTTKERLRLCYIVMQDVNHQLFTESVLDEILLSMDGENEETDKTEAEKILKSLNLWEFKDMHPMSLSGGQKQRVAIGSSIASQKKILVFDEPTSGLDYRHMLEVSGNLRNLSAMGKTLFVITHDPELIAYSCNYFLFIDHGEIAWSYPLGDESKSKVCKFLQMRDS